MEVKTLPRRLQCYVVVEEEEEEDRERRRKRRRKRRIKTKCKDHTEGREIEDSPVIEGF